MKDVPFSNRGIRVAHRSRFIHCNGSDWHRVIRGGGTSLRRAEEGNPEHGGRRQFQFTKHSFRLLAKGEGVTVKIVTIG